MNFTEAVAEVLSIVKRPDKIVDIRREVNAACNHFSADGCYEFDLHEQTLTLDPLEYSQAVAVSEMTRFRRFWYVKRAGTKQYLRKLDVAKLGRTDCDMRDRYYIVGTNLNINMTALAAALDVGFFRYPPLLTDAAPTYWMLDHGPYMVIDRAAAKIFANIGDDASARRHEGFALTAHASFRSEYSRPASEYDEG
jgi:hypothetical protein